MTPTITCFGEILWDVLPTSKQPGGAPMNVAADLRNFGLNAQLISRVGSDDLGRELIDFLAKKGIPTELVQVGQSAPDGRGEGQYFGHQRSNVQDSTARCLGLYHARTRSDRGGEAK